MEKIDSLFDIIQKLRSKNGCAWDQKQTPETMWKCLAEETYELQEAIAKKDSQHICEELGDVLFQLVFILELFQESRTFTLSDVIEGVAKKMIGRHPHVYGNAKVETEEELNIQWDAIKSKEQSKNNQKRLSALDAVPKGMPSLIRALKVSKCAVKEGFEWNNIYEVLDTAKAEIDEFESALKSGNQNDIMMEFGDVLFSLVNVARFADFHPETALASSTAKFEGRFRIMENELKKKQTSLRDLSCAQIDQIWEQAKQFYDNKN